jgi:eukaryotic-like serine/threonine-protein kinase
VVIDQDPPGGSRLIQTGIVTITVARGNPEPETAEVPGVVGLAAAVAETTLRDAGFAVAVVLEQECDPADPACVYRQGVAWSQSPAGGDRAPLGSTVTVLVNP